MRTPARPSSIMAAGTPPMTSRLPAQETARLSVQRRRVRAMDALCLIVIRVGPSWKEGTPSSTVGMGEEFDLVFGSKTILCPLKWHGKPHPRFGSLRSSPRFDRDLGFSQNPRTAGFRALPSPTSSSPNFAESSTLQTTHRPLANSSLPSPTSSSSSQWSPTERFPAPCGANPGEERCQTSSMVETSAR
jgi:hypothetical protein